MLLQPLGALSGTYGIGAVKGFSPHWLNTRAHFNKNDIERAPNEKYVGTDNMSNRKYDKFKERYTTVEGRGLNYKEHLLQYCEDDVSVL